MFSSHTNKTYYIGTKVREISSGKIGIIYNINILGSNGLKVRFSDNTKKGYFGSQLNNLEIIA